MAQKRYKKRYKKRYYFLMISACMLTLASIGWMKPSNAANQNCSCTLTGGKDYQVYQEGKNFWGKRKVHRKWTCEYTCSDGHDSEKVVGSYEMTNTGDDNGFEGICEGLVYESEFNAYTMREVYQYKSTSSFNPRKSDAEEVQLWAQQHSCR